MRFDSKTLPDNIRKCMPQQMRKEMKVPTMADVEEKTAKGEERKLHKHFENWCLLKSIPYIHSRTDKKSTIAVGWPDFTLLRDGRACCIELKTEGGVLSPEQIEKIGQLREWKVPVLVTCSLAEAIRFTTEHIGL